MPESRENGSREPGLLSPWEVRAEGLPEVLESGGGRKIEDGRPVIHAAG